jgi:hypothetical protein
MATQNSITLNTHELLLILGTLGPSVVMGIEDPYLGLLSEEVETAQQNALQSLASRGMIQSVSETQIEFQEDLSTLANVLHQPTHSIIIQESFSVITPRQAFLHFSKDWILHHIPSEEDTHQLRLVNDVTDMIEHLTPTLRLDSSSECQEPSFTIPEETLWKTRKLCAERDEEGAMRCLDQAGLEENIAVCLYTTIQNPIANSSFVLIANRNIIESQYVQGFSILEGGDMMWIMQPYAEEDQAMVTFHPSNASQNKEWFLQMLPGGGYE